MFAKNTLNHYPQLCPHTLPDGPINGRIFPNSLNQMWYKSFEEDFNITMITAFNSPVTSNGKLYITGHFIDSEQEKWSGIILALNQSNGSLIWKKVLPINANAISGFQMYHSPAVYEGKIFTVLGCFFTFMSSGTPSRRRSSQTA